MSTEVLIAKHPVVKALRPYGLPYLGRLSGDADFQVWHIDVNLEEFNIPPRFVERWSDGKLNTAETWRKRPLAVSEDTDLPYSCGEIEVVTRLRQVGFEAVWLSEWSGFRHVDIWRSRCIKRSEFQKRCADLWEFDRQLRTDSPHKEALGLSGGHPDVAVRTPDGYVFVEYKGPGDTIRPKQRMWAETIIGRDSARLSYVVVRGLFSASNQTGPIARLPDIRPPYRRACRRDGFVPDDSKNEKSYR